MAREWSKYLEFLYSLKIEITRIEQTRKEQPSSDIDRLS